MRIVFFLSEYSDVYMLLDMFLALGSHRSVSSLFTQSKLFGLVDNAGNVRVRLFGSEIINVLYSVIVYIPL